ncbi:MAG TPA: flagellar assembly protein FliX [Phenylobacterium sp.]
MKVSGANNVGSTGGPGKAKPAGGAAFSVPSPAAASGPAQVTRAAGVGGVVGLDALLALQDVGGPLERKRRAVGRAGRILDVLDELKAALLDGAPGGDDVERLRRAVRDERQLTDDPGLEGVLNEIETRAAVELAKLEQSPRAA